MTTLGTQIYKTPPLTDAYACAHIWLSRGFYVLPCQPDSKHLVRGFGPNLQRICGSGEVDYWFRARGANLAVMAPDWAVILDFDQGDLYDHFTAAWPDMAITYTESTRRGFHVFFKLADGARPVVPGLIRGVEVKRFCLVHPSRVGGVEYEIMQPGPILTFSATRVQEALQPFLEPGGENIQPYPPAGRCASPGANQSHKSGDRRNHGMMAKVKAAWPILAYLLYFEPKLQLRGEGRWRSGKCPWHHDNKPSLWVDVERNTWGCHACGLHGDIVNWHALRLGVKDMVLTMRDLAGYNVTVWLE